MQPHFLRPSVFLEPYIDYYFVLDDATGQEAVEGMQVYPGPHGQMVFSWGNPSYERWLDGPPAGSPDFAISGYSTRPVTYYNPGGVGVLMVGFKPWGLQPFLDVGAKEISNCNSDMALHFGRQLAFVEDQLREARSLEERVRLVEAFLAGRLRRPVIDRAMVEAVQRIAQSGGALPVEQLAASCYLGRRQFLRRFEASIGISPKMFSRIVRFQRAFAAMDTPEPGPDWSGVAYQSGYFDQAHFIQDFREFTGLAPAEFYRQAHGSAIGAFFAEKTAGEPLYHKIYL